MNYYYSLLESYDLLKKRKFKLSVDEARGAISKPGKGGPKERPADAGAPTKQEDPARGPAAEAAVAFLQTAFDAPGQPQTHGDLTATAKPKQIGGNPGDMTVSVEGMGWTSRYSRAGGIAGVDGGAVSWSGPNNTPLTADANLKSAAGKLVTAFMDESEDTDTDSTDDQGQDVDQNAPPMLTPEEIAQNEEALTTATQLKDWFKAGWSNWLGFKQRNQPSDLFPGYKPVKKLEPRPFREAWYTQKGEEIADEEDLAQQTENTGLDLATPEDKLAALGTAKTLMETIRKLHGTQSERDSITPRELNDLAANMQITRHGVLFGPPDGNPLYLQYRTKSNGTVDLYRNSANQINDLIREKNEEAEGSDNTAINLIPVPQVMGSLTSKRGDLLEHMTVFNDWAQQWKELKCDEKGDWLDKEEYKKWSDKCVHVDGKLQASLKEARDRGLPEEIQKMFEVGGRVLAGEVLASFKDSQDAEVVENILDYMIAEHGLSESHAAAIVAAAINSPDPQISMLLLINSTLGYNSWTEGLDIEDSWVSGGEGQLKGQKADVMRIATKKTLDRLKAKIRKAREGSIEEDLTEAAGCMGSDTGIGLDNLGEASDDGETIRFGTEQKALSSSSGRTKLGEGKNNKFSQMCTPVLDENGKPMTDDNGRVIDGRPRNTEKQKAAIEEEDKFMDLNDKRLANCLNSDGAKKFKGSLGKNEDGEARTLKEAACAFQNKIDEAMEPYSQAFTGVSLEGVQSDVVGHEYINKWLDPKKGSLSICKGPDSPGEDKCQRATLARKAVTVLANGEKPTSEQSEALRKVRGEIEQRKIQESFDNATSKDKVEGEAFLIYRMSIEGGATEESFKDVRSYGSDRYQRVGLINDTVYGSISMFLQGNASISSGGNTHSLSTRDGTKLLGVSMERDQAVIDLNDDIMSDIDTEIEEPKEESGDLFKAYLNGQQKLLEVLLSQTT